MIVADRKPIEEIIGYLKDHKNILVLGCNECVTVCEAGGKKEVYDKSLKILKVMGKKIFYIGKSGMGSYMKLVVNLIAAIINQAMAEGLVLGAKSGIDPELLLEVLSAGAGKAALIEVKGPAILKRNFKANFALRHITCN